MKLTHLLLPLTATLALATASSAQAVTAHVSLSEAAPGQSVKVTLCNDSPYTIQLPSACLFRSVWRIDAPVRNFYCSSVISYLYPGQSTSMSWDQKNDWNGQVPDDLYYFEINYTDVYGSHTLWPTVNVATQAAAPAAPIDRSIDASFYDSFGNYNGGGYAYADAQASLHSESYSQYGVPQNAFELGADAHAEAGATLFGVSVEAFRMDAEASMSGDTGSSNGTQGSAFRFLRVGGYTQYAYGAFDLTWNSPSYSSQIVSTNRSYYLGLGVSINVAASASVIARANLTLNSNPFQHEVRVTASPSITVRGTASGAFDGYLVRAGVEASLDLLSTTVEVPLIADLESGLSGYMTVSTVPAAASLSAFLDVGSLTCSDRFWGVCYWWTTSWSRVATLPLISWSAPALYSTIQLF